MENITMNETENGYNLSYQIKNGIPVMLINETKTIED